MEFFSPDGRVSIIEGVLYIVKSMEDFYLVSISVCASIRSHIRFLVENAAISHHSDLQSDTMLAIG